MELEEVRFKVKSPKGDKEFDYVMKEMAGEEDLAYQMQFTNPTTGSINVRNLWVRRLVRCIVSPPMTDTKLSALPAWHFQTLIRQWMLMNEPTMPEQASFLEDSKKETNQS